MGGLQREAGRREMPDGFTLIELIVVLAVISLILALTVPNLRRSPASYALSGVAQNVAAALRLARNQAILEDRTVRFVTSDGRFGPAGDRSLQDLPEGVSLSGISQSDTAAARPIRFYPDGSSSGGGISLTAGAARYLVLVNWLNGDVSIHPQAARPSQ